MLDISVHVACPADVLHDVDAFWLQCAMNTFEHIERLRLIVNGIGGCDEVDPAVTSRPAIRVRTVR
jgi:hypothetical protein